MNKMNTLIIAISLAGILTASVSYATFEGGGTSLGTISALFAKLDVLNTFSKSQKVNVTDETLGGIYTGVRVQTNERASVCIGPSDGTPYEYCFSGGNTLDLHGNATGIWNGNTRGNRVISASPWLERYWFAPSGSAVFGGGVQPPIESAFMVGSNLNNAATLLVDTTNDWIKVLPISAPAATECDAADERGRIYYDSGTDKLKYCNGTAWTDL